MFFVSFKLDWNDTQVLMLCLRHGKGMAFSSLNVLIIYSDCNFFSKSRNLSNKKKPHGTISDKMVLALYYVRNVWLNNSVHNRNAQNSKIVGQHGTAACDVQKLQNRLLAVVFMQRYTAQQRFEIMKFSLKINVRSGKLIRTCFYFMRTVYLSCRE